MDETNDNQKECPSCALPVDADAEICPYCGYEFPPQKRNVKIFAVLFILLMLIWVFWDAL